MSINTKPGKTFENKKLKYSCVPLTSKKPKQIKIVKGYFMCTISSLIITFSYNQINLYTICDDKKKIFMYLAYDNEALIITWNSIK